jgi:hypothetical protein
MQATPVNTYNDSHPNAQATVTVGRSPFHRVSE